MGGGNQPVDSPGIQAGSPVGVHPSQSRALELAAKIAAGNALSADELGELGRLAAPRPQVAVGDGDLFGDVRRAKLTKADEERYSALYRKGWRQLRRWIEKGEKANDPCPLHDPVALMHWWPRHNTWRVPPEVEEAAVAASRPSASGVAMTATPEAQPPAPAASTDQPVGDRGKTPPPGAPVDLASFDPEEGDRLRELKQIQAAKFSQLSEALKRGEDCSILEAKYVKLSETIDKIETRATERLKKRGLLIHRDAVERDLAAACELLRQAQSSMERRILELCPSLSADQRIEVSAAIARARRSEERMLSRLPTMESDDLLSDLHAA